MIGWKPQCVFLSGSLVVTIVSTFIPGWTDRPFKPPEQVILAVSVFSAFLVIDVLLLVRTVAATRQKELERWGAEEALDAHLTAIRKEYSALVRKRHGDDDLFVAHYNREIRDLGSDIHKSSHLDELWVGDRHSQTVGKVMSAFLAETKPVHRSVWIMEPNERLFELQPDREYVSDFVKAATKRSFGGVRTLCVVASEEHLKDVRIRAFLDFYKTTPKFECRVVLAKEYESALADDQISAEFIDFGIYGTRMIFLTASYEGVRKGVFVRRKAEVDKYIELFDRIWNSQFAKANPSNRKCRLTLEELIVIDEGETCEMSQ